jgi:OmcA/MtrC family decaheme c-type cytochrome
VKVASLTPDQWANATFKAEVTSVTIASPPVVNFKVTDAAGNPVVGLGSTSKSSTATVPGYTNLSFAMAKLVPGTPSLDPSAAGPSKWVSYIVTTVPTTTATLTATRPSTDNTGTLVDNLDGTYKYTFYRDVTKVKEVVAGLTLIAPSVAADLGDLTYEPNLTHRLVLQLSGNAPGTGTNTPNALQLTPGVALKNPLNVIYDFIPATGKAVAVTDTATQRLVVDTANCNACHDKLQALGFHGGSRNDARFCVVCHTDQRKFGYAEATTTATGYSGTQRKIDGMAVGDFPSFIHKLHRGKELAKTGYDYAGVKFNDITYSMSAFAPDGQKMCSTCHAKSATAPQGDNWSTVPGAMACGSCHDGIKFSTGSGTRIDGRTDGHVGGAQANDTKCALCHTPAANKTYHMTDNVTPHNPTIAAGLKTFTYEIKSAAATASNVTVVFKISADGTPVTLLPAAAAMANPLAGFTGGPSFVLAYAQPQDGVLTPVDYNNLGSNSSLLNAQPIGVSLANLLDTAKATSVGTLSGPDASGYYTATIVGNDAGAAKIFPVGATMRAVALQGYFTQITSPASVTAPIARHAISVIKPVGTDAVRRTVVDAAKCANCHEWIEAHGGNRVYETQVCVTCHVPGNSTSGRGIPDSALQTYPFTASDNAIMTLWGFNKTLVNAAVNFPVTSNDFKDMIHGIHAGKDRTLPFRDARDRLTLNLDGTYKSGAITLLDGSKGGFPGILSNCETACHKPGTYSTVPANALASTQEANNGTVPMTTATYKASFIQPNPTDKVTTPYAAACVSCHDKALSQAHISLNGGQINVVRSALVLANETCAVCHGAGREFDPVAVHKNLK